MNGREKVWSLIPFSLVKKYVPFFGVFFSSLQDIKETFQFESSKISFIEIRMCNRAYK